MRLACSVLVWSVWHCLSACVLVCLSAGLPRAQGAYRVLLFAAEDAGDEIDSDEEQLRRQQSQSGDEGGGEGEGAAAHDMAWHIQMKEKIIKWDSFRQYLVVNNYLENYAEVAFLGIGRVGR